MATFSLFTVGGGGVKSNIRCVRKTEKMAQIMDKPYKDLPCKNGHDVPCLCGSAITTFPTELLKIHVQNKLKLEIIIICFLKLPHYNLPFLNLPLQNMKFNAAILTLYMYVSSVIMCILLIPD